jgi:hypothetical protein
VMHRFNLDLFLSCEDQINTVNKIVWIKINQNEFFS